MRSLLSLALAAATLGVSPAHAQFGSGIVFDPTQSAHAVQQIAQGNQLYTTTIETTRNVIAAYNLAQRMASLPQTLYTAYSNLGRQEWFALMHSANTYGNSAPLGQCRLNWLWRRDSKSGGQHTVLRPHCWLRLAQSARQTSNRSTGRNRGSFQCR